MPTEAGTILYTHRAKPFSNPLEIALDTRELVAERGRSRQVYPLGAIERIRLSYSPRNTARLGFRCEIRARDGASVTFDNLDWKSMIELQRQDEGYTRLVRTLVGRAARANGAIRLEAGVSLARHRLMLGVGVLVLGAMVAAAGLALANKSWPIALLAAGLGVYFGLWLREYLTRNRPRDFSAAGIPETVLPPLPGGSEP